MPWLHEETSSSTAGATIQTDPQTSGGGGVSLTGQTVTVLGSVIAPGGTISIKGGSDSTTLFSANKLGLITVDLGPDSRISTAGTTLLTQDFTGPVPRDAGYVNTGRVIAGGSVTLAGNIVTEANPSNPNSVINVSGWSDAKDPWGLLEMAPQFSGIAASTGPLQTPMQVLIPTLEASNGGNITLKAAQTLFPDKSNERGRRGSESAKGGTLTVSGQTFGALPGSSRFLRYSPRHRCRSDHSRVILPGRPDGHWPGRTRLRRDSFVWVEFGDSRRQQLLLGRIRFAQSLRGGVLPRYQPDQLLRGERRRLLSPRWRRLPPSLERRLCVGEYVPVSVIAAEVSLGQSYLPPILCQRTKPLLFTDGLQAVFPVTGGGGSRSRSVRAATRSNPRA